MERENIHRSDAHSKHFRVHGSCTIGLGDDGADRILVPSEIRNTNSEPALLTSIVATNPGTPDNFTSNVGGRGYHASTAIKMSTIKTLSEIAYIGLIVVGKSGRYRDGETHTRRTNGIVRVLDPEIRSDQTKLHSQSTSPCNLPDIQLPFNLTSSH